MTYSWPCSCWYFCGHVVAWWCHSVDRLFSSGTCKWARVTCAVRIQWRRDSPSGAVWWFPWIATCVPLLDCVVLPVQRFTAFWHVYVLWLGYPLKWPCNTTLIDFLVTSSSIKNPMRRHNAVIQCASGHVSFAIWYRMLYTHWLFVSVTSVHVSVSRDLATPKGCIHNN